MTSYNLQSAFVIRQTNTEILVRQALRLVGIYDGGVQNHSWEGSSKNNSRSPERRIRNSDQSGVDRSDLPVDLLGLHRRIKRRRLNRNHLRHTGIKDSAMQVFSPDRL